MKTPSLKILQRLHALISRAFGTTFEGEAHTSAMLALKLMKQHGMLDDLMAFGDSLQALQEKKPKVRRHRSTDALRARQGGLARAASLTSEQRSDIARKAAQSRWDKKRPKLNKSRKR